MNFPSLSNFTIRALPVAVPPPLCPSPTKMSPLGAMATSVGASNSSQPGPATPFLPSVINTFPSSIELEDLVSPVVGHPHVPFFVHRQFVRADKHPSAKRLQHLAGRIELEDGVDLGAGSAAGRAPAPELPHRSATQIVPSGAVVTLAVDPHFLPSGNCPQFTPARYGLGRSLRAPSIDAGGSFTGY